ncbi:MAG: hypothetical protein A2Y82_05095 [Candidatus Buchananbacteria bacterium RBG_13_36_9]|uniref:Uncharacterized protein n=1 Tax=Candidatus Buchananbacteria bacterium RBG_13_36_9 TaxID=1797530 RepID=A0A1G1XPF4_9BACT|nr:MAG: hypothetical protein A2Y82_05095 [Candidatus Buchananbacteria bacterium RBG_13_36_9]
MKKGILIIDWLLIIIFLLMILSKFVTLELAKFLQPLFFVLIIVHIVQHWKIVVNSLRKIVIK